MKNPYPGRPHPVGASEYPMTSKAYGKVRASLESGEKQLLYDMPRIIGGGLIANLGHGRTGGSAILMAIGIRDLGLEGHVISVDVFKQSDDIYDRALQIIARHEVTELIELRKGPTREVVKLMWNQRFKFVFIDADHSYEGVLNDFKDWSRLIERGGFVGFHDTNQEYSHQVIVEELLDNPDWAEHKNLHINRIRIFEKLT